MKKYIAVLLLLFCVFALSAEVYDEPLFKPAVPSIMGQGNSQVAVAAGYEAFFSNPAGFARGKREITILGLNPVSFFFPSNDKFEAFSMLGSDPVAAVDKLQPYLADGGIGIGNLTGFSYAGNGLGLGFFSNTEVMAQGRKAMGSSVDVYTDLVFVAGLAFPLNLFGVQFYWGADVRPLFRLHGRNLVISDFLGDDAGNPPFLSGSGLAFDAGIIAELSDFTIGLALRDVFGTKLNYSVVTLQDIQEGGLFAKSSVTPSDAYVIPFTVSFGASWNPDLGLLEKIVDPAVHFEYQKIFAKETDYTFLTGLHLGAEVKVLSLLKLRAGLNQGYPTVGMGIKLLVFDINVAAFGRELSNFAGASGNAGISAEFALRF